MSSPVATTALTYNGFVTQLGLMAVYQTQTIGGVVSGVDASFTALIPMALNYAELRIQRDCDLNPLQSSTTYALTNGVNQIAISVNDFVTIQDISVTVSGLSQALLPVSKEFLQYVYPSTATPAPPLYFSVVGGDFATAGNTSTLIQFGPPPDSNYTATVFGTIRMPTLNGYNTNPQASTATTFISTWLPDLLIVAAMIYISAYQRNFGKIADDPAMAMTYEAQYQALLHGAQGEEGRKRFQASAWSSMAQPVAATADR